MRFEGKPIRIYVDGRLGSSAETYLRRATFRPAITGPLELLPVSPCPKTRYDNGIVDALRFGRAKPFRSWSA